MLPVFITNRLSKSEFVIVDFHPLHWPPESNPRL
nr:MAG TPA: hypothetical protein [Caudoviricetes sp.]